MTFKKNAVSNGCGSTVVRAFGSLGERDFLDHRVSVGRGTENIPAADRVAMAEVDAHDGQAKGAQA